MEALLALRSDSLTAVFRGLTFMGDPTFFLVVFSLAYWLWRRDLMARMTCLLLFAVLFNSVLKAFFQIPRPTEYRLTEAEGWSFPSNHAQIAATVWPWLGLELRRRWLALPLTLVVAGVALSRVYLGVHTFADVVVGVAIGFTTVALLWRSRDSWTRVWLKLPREGKLLTALGTVLVGFLLIRGPVDPVAAVAGGGLMGFALGHLYGPVSGAPRVFWRSVLAGSIGLLGLFALRVVLKGALAELPVSAAVADFVRYGCLGLWISALAPGLFLFFKITAPQTEGIAGESPRL